MPTPRRQAPRYIQPKITKSGDESRFDTVRLYPPRTTADIIAGYILSSGELRSARRLWIVGYGMIGENNPSDPTRGGERGYITVMPARRGDAYGNAGVRHQLEEALGWFTEIDHIDINRRVK